MSSKHQKYSQKTIPISTQSHAIEAGLPSSKNGIYFPFQMPSQDFYYKYMFPFPEATQLPYFPHPYLPQYQYLPPHPSPSVPRRVGVERAMKPQSHMMRESQEERGDFIKVEHQESPEVKQAVFPARLAQEKSGVKQLYSLGQLHAKLFLHDKSGLSPRFKKVLLLYIQEVQEKESFQSLYCAQFSKEREESPAFFEELMVALSKKIRTYKKTKEELIKFIIRRTYHNLRVKKNMSNKPEYDRLESFHQKQPQRYCRNLATFKSMNIMFLRREFSNPLFVEFYKEFLINLDSQFQTENQEKVERLSHTLSHCWSERSTKLLLSERKLPWINSYKLRIKKIALALLCEYQGSIKQETTKSKPLDN